MFFMLIIRSLFLHYSWVLGNAYMVTFLYVHYCSQQSVMFLVVFSFEIVSNELKTLCPRAINLLYQEVLSKQKFLLTTLGSLIVISSELSACLLLVLYCSCCCQLTSLLFVYHARQKVQGSLKWPFRRWWKVV